MFKRLWKKEDGQVLVMAALLLATLLGFAALVIDVGNLYVEKQQLQTVVDAAALAGAQDLPDTAKAKNTALVYAELNGLDRSNLTVTAPYKGSAHQIEVVSNKNVQNSFAKIFGSDDSDVSTRAVATYGIAGSVPWIVPFVIPEPPEFNYDKVYVMRMYGAGDYPSNYSFPKDFLDKYGSYVSYRYSTTSKNTKVYGTTSTRGSVSFTIGNRGSEVTFIEEKTIWDYRTATKWYKIKFSRNTGWVPASAIEKKILSNYPYQFDYMNVKIDAAQTFNDYTGYLENGYHKTYSVDQLMKYYAPSSGGEPSVNAFARRISADSNKDYKKAKVGDSRVMLIPVVKNMLPRGTSGKTDIKIIGFAAFYLENVYKNSYGESFWFEGRFLKDLNIGGGQTTVDPNADFGLRILQLIE